MSEIQQKLELIRLQFDNLEMMLNSSASQPSEHSPMVLKFSNERPTWYRRTWAVSFASRTVKIRRKNPFETHCWHRYPNPNIRHRGSGLSMG